jgi:hypothetical protein
MRYMKSRSLVPKPWWKVGLVVLPGLVFLIGQACSNAAPWNEGLRFLLLAVVILLSASSVLLAAIRRSPFNVPVWGFIPLGLLAEWGLDATIGSFYATCFLLVIIGLLFARLNGLGAGLFVLAGAIPPMSSHIEQVIYFWDRPLWGKCLELSITLLFFVFAPVWVLRSSAVYSQAVGLWLPIIAYFTALVSALSVVRGFPLVQSMSIAAPVIVVFGTISVAITLYAWISSRTS